MSYATRQDMVTTIGERELIELTDREQTGAINDSVLAGALATAEAEVDSYLAGRYPLPFPNPPLVLTAYTCDIARYHLGRDGDVVVSENMRERYRDAIRYLEKVAEGKVSLGRDATGEEVATEDTVVMESGGRVFGRSGGW
ncbi:gp436 family protein [Pseudogulbenkiania ferrooxidans]|uniref:DUF1320 domain-containing protein n=1 Tax=Pseudogulbenkiania ferrooxidans 2002 TaxID=279714 RepID=B9Z306_9NEIS|nr:phage protein Gp36 family protein [Pseudogulbenkiania ferrooxidans]EEG08959.1 protein of unknown function DUF1320 [Pseudogulbenkiania ferrooxidans 2002]